VAPRHLFRTPDAGIAIRDRPNVRGAVMEAAMFTALTHAAELGQMKDPRP